MNIKDKKEALVFFTFRDVENILTYGGSCSWALSSKRAAACDFILCVHNSNSVYSTAPPARHGTGFLLGRVSKVEPTPEKTDPVNSGVPPIGPKRIIVRISEYVEVEIARFWQGNRNPTHYVDEDMILSALGIASFDELDFLPVPERDLDKIAEFNRAHTEARRIHEFNGRHVHQPAEVEPMVRIGLTMDEAKSGIARQLGIEPGQVEITIRA